MDVSLLSTSAEVGLEQADRNLLRRRCRITFGLGLLVTAGLLAAGEIHSVMAGHTSPDASERWVYAAYLGVFVLGSVAVGANGLGTVGLRIVALCTVAGLVFVLAADTVLHEPDYPPLALVALILFGAAALLPWRAKYQAALVIESLVAIPVMRLTLDIGTGSPGWWSWPVGGPDPESNALFGAIGVALLGAVSVAVTRTLYRLHRRVREAEYVGGYRLVEPLGEGGMGTVWLAEHARMCRPSAVKVVTAEPYAGSRVIERFQREIKLASRLDHPHTIEIRDYGRADESTFFFAMEYLVGLDLQRLVDRFGPVEPARSVYILRQVCDSLGEAHDMGIVHRDLKPPNVFITRRGGVCDFVKVLDFGLAREVDPEGQQQITATGAIMGTPQYMAPEAVQGSEGYGPKGDLYSLGCTAYWLLTGAPPFQGDSAEEIMLAHVTQEPIPVTNRSELQIPPGLAEVVMKCLQKDPADRPADVRAIHEAMEAVELEECWSAERAAAWWNLHLAETA